MFPDPGQKGWGRGKRHLILILILISWSSNAAFPPGPRGARNGITSPGIKTVLSLGGTAAGVTDIVRYREPSRLLRKPRSYPTQCCNFLFPAVTQEAPAKESRGQGGTCPSWFPAEPRFPKTCWFGEPDCRCSSQLPCSPAASGSKVNQPGAPFVPGRSRRSWGLGGAGSAALVSSLFSQHLALPCPQQLRAHALSRPHWMSPGCLASGGAREGGRDAGLRPTSILSPSSTSSFPREDLPCCHLGMGTGRQERGVAIACLQRNQLCPETTVTLLGVCAPQFSPLSQDSNPP